MSNNVNPGKVLEISSNFQKLVHHNFDENNVIFFKEVEEFLGRYMDPINEPFWLHHEFKVTLPNDYDSVRRLKGILQSEEKHKPDIEITETDLLSVTDKLESGKTYLIKIFGARKKRNSFEECYEFLKSQGALWVGAQGALLLYEQDVCDLSSLYYLCLNQNNQPKTNFGAHIVPGIYRGDLSLRRNPWFINNYNFERMTQGKTWRLVCFCEA